MNEFEPVTTRQIDQLVDGELSGAQRRTVLLALDQEPEGWRRLAVAFLESQALRDSVRQRVEYHSIREREYDVTNTAADRPAKHLPHHDRHGKRALSIVATAVCGILLFLAGRSSHPPVRIQAGSQVPVASTPTTYAPGVTPDSLSESQSVATSSGITGSSMASPLQRTMRLELGDGHDGKVQQVEVPMVETGSINPLELLTGPSVIPDDIQRALLRQGRRVYEQRQLVPVTLEDGREGIVPISDVVVVDAGIDAFQ